MQKDEDVFLYYLKTENVEEIKKFLQNTREIWKYKIKENENSSVLHTSVYENNYEITEIILNYCKEKLSKDCFLEYINGENSQGIAPIHYAAYMGNIKIINLLIINGADVKKTNRKSLNVIHYAAQGNQPNSLYYFKNKTDIDFNTTDAEGCTPLHWACYMDSEDAFKYLIFYGADINALDNQNNTPLHMAINTQKVNFIKMILREGAEPDIKNAKERTPYDIAIVKNYRNIAKIFIKRKKCELCSITPPTRKTKKSRTNIYIVCIMQLTCIFILFTSVYPCIIYHEFYKKANGFRNFLLVIQYYGHLISLLLFFIFFVYLIFSNPGKDEELDEKKIEEYINDSGDLKNICPKCRTFKDKETKHCFICDKCCKDFDHHCYWVNNCIGKNNYWVFLLFLVIANINLIIILSISILAFFEKYIDDNEKLNDLREHWLKTKKFIEFSLYTVLFKGKLLKLIFNIILLISNLFFFIPVLFLLIFHIRNTVYNMKLEKRLAKVKKNQLYAGLDE